MAPLFPPLVDLEGSLWVRDPYGPNFSCFYGIFRQCSQNIWFALTLVGRIRYGFNFNVCIVNLLRGFNLKEKNTCWKFYSILFSSHLWIMLLIPQSDILHVHQFSNGLISASHFVDPEDIWDWDYTIDS